MKQGADELIDRYARHMLVENAIQDAVNFFHMDALSSTIPLRIDLDLQSPSLPVRSIKRLQKDLTRFIVSRK